MARIDVDIDVDDMLWDMNRLEKQEMADKLYDHGYVPNKLQDELDQVLDRQASGNTEVELSNLLDAVWDNRMFLNSNDLEVLKHLSKKGL
jgi:hypothetical protein